MSLTTQRIYEENISQGTRILVDRVWPRGVRKEEARVDKWMKGIAPSPELRKWFAHDPAKWEEFKKRYFRELENHRDDVQELLQLARRGKVCLLFGAKDKAHNNAVALREFLERHL